MRTDIDSVKAVIQTSLADAQIIKLIVMAGNIITRTLSTAGLTAEALTDIETYFTAYLISIGPERQAQREKIGDIEVTYQDPDNEFWKMVLMLDTSGKLAGLTKKKVQFRAIAQEDETNSINIIDW